MIPFRLVKSLDIMYIVAIQFLLAVGLNIVLDSIVKRFDSVDDEHKQVEYTYPDFIKQILIVIIIVCIFAVVSYFARATIKHIPSPFDGISGFKHIRLKEMQEVGSLTAFLFLTSDYLDSKIKTVRKMFEKLII